MKREWLAYVIVAVLSVGVGVLVTGVPKSEGVGVSLVVPITTDAEQVDAVTTVAAPEVTAEPTESSTTIAAEATTTTAAPGTTVESPVLPDRSEEIVVVANGAEIPGIAGAVAGRLEALTYESVRVTDGTELASFSTVYYIAGSEPSAVRLAGDLDLELNAVAPMAEAPAIVGGVENESLLVYIGVDLG